MKSLNKNIKFLYIIIICFLFINLLGFLNIIPMLISINPIIWILIATIGYFIAHSDYNHFFNSKDKLETIIIILLIYLIVYFSLGLIFGYSYNVYNNSELKAILINLYLYIIPLFFQEYIRGILCNYSSNSSKLKVIISIIFILINININSLFNINIKFIILSLIPAISLEFVMTYLCCVGGYKLSFIYKLFITLFNVFIPILPNINYFLIGFLSTIIPVIIYFIIDSKHEKELKKVYFDYSNKKIYSYIPFLVILILGFLNIYGVLKYQTISILSNSMNPLYSKGDAVIIKNLNNKEKNDLKVGDIIAFYDDKNNTIVHRIVEINNNEELKIITKGDNNDSNDTKILKLENIKGKYLFHIKYLGYPTLLIYETLN